MSSWSSRIVVWAAAMVLLFAAACASDQNTEVGQAQPTAVMTVESAPTRTPEIAEEPSAVPDPTAVALPTTVALPTAVVADERTVPTTPEPTPTRVPWGVVVDQDGVPVAEAQVFIERFDEQKSEFVSVGNSTYVSEETRRGQTFTNDAGEFSWGVLPGTYRVAARAIGCVAANDDSDVGVSDSRQVPPAARNLVVRLDCTAREFGDFELRIVLLASTQLEAPIPVDVSCVDDGRVVFEQTVQWIEEFRVERLPLETSCSAEVVGGPENFRLLGGAIESVVISSIHGNPIEFVGVNGPVSDEIVVSLFVREELPDMTVAVGFTAVCDTGLVDSFDLSPGGSHTIEPLFIGDACTVTVDQPSVFEMEEYSLQSVALGLTYSEPPANEADDVYFVLLSAP